MQLTRSEPILEELEERGPRDPRSVADGDLDVSLAVVRLEGSRSKGNLASGSVSPSAACLLLPSKHTATYFPSSPPQQSQSFEAVRHFGAKDSVVMTSRSCFLVLRRIISFPLG